MLGLFVSHLIYCEYPNVFTWPGMCPIVSSAGCSDDREGIMLINAKIMSLYWFNGKTTPCTLNWLSFKELQICIKGNEQNQADTPLHWGKEKPSLQNTTRQQDKCMLSQRRQGKERSPWNEINPVWSPYFVTTSSWLREICQLQECKGLRWYF